MKALRTGLSVALVAGVLAGAAFPGPVARAADPARSHLVVGLKAFKDGFHDLAAKELRTYLDTSAEVTRRAAVLAVLARAEIARQNWTGADAALAELAGTDAPEAADAEYWRGWVARRQGDAGAARGHLDRYLETGNGSRRGDALLLAAQVATDLGDAQTAVRRYREFLSAAPKDSRRAGGWSGLIDAYLAAGNPGSARDDALVAVKDPLLAADKVALQAVLRSGVEAARRVEDPAGEARLWALLAENTDAPEVRREARLAQGGALYRAGQVAAAGAPLREVLAAAPPVKEAVEAHVLLSEVARRGKDEAGALQHLESALAAQDEPELRRRALQLALKLNNGASAATHAAALLPREGALTPAERGALRAVLARQAEGRDPAAAIAHWSAVPATAPNFRTARLAAAELLLDGGRAGEALAVLAPLRGQADPDGAVRTLALVAAEKAGRRREAAGLAAELARSAPPGTDPIELLARRALLLREDGDLAGWRATLEEICRTGPGHPRTPWAAGELQRLAVGEGRWQDSLQWYEALAAAAPRSIPSAALLGRAEALLRLGHPDEAATTLERIAARGDAEAGSALARLAALRDEQGRTADAVAAYRAALEAGVPDSARAWIAGRLSQLEAAGRAGPAPGKEQ